MKFHFHFYFHFLILLVHQAAGRVHRVLSEKVLGSQSAMAAGSRTRHCQGRAHARQQGLSCVALSDHGALALQRSRRNQLRAHLRVDQDR